MAKFIKFREKASVTAAKADATDTDGRMDVVKSENALVYEGSAVIRGISDAQAEYVNQKIKEVNDAKATISFSVSPSATFVKGTSTAFTLTLTCKFDGKNVDADALPTMEAAGQSVTVTKKSTGVYTGTVNASSTTKFDASATVKGVSRSASQTVSAYNQILYGVSSYETAPVSDASEMAKFLAQVNNKKLQANSNGTYTFTFTEDKPYGYILIPSDVTISDSLAKHLVGKDGPLPVNFVKQADATGTGVTYSVYRMAESQGAGSEYNVELYKE